MLADFLALLWNRFPAALLLARLLVVPLSLMLHELAHGLMAVLLGDPTPREQGRLTLNPLPHLEPIAAITGVLLGFGWSRPTPFRPHHMRLPGWIGGPLVVLAGPLASLGLLLGGQALLNLPGLAPEYLWSGLPTLPGLLTVWVRFNLGLVLINLLPLFPLDAYALIRSLLPLRPAHWWQRASGWTTALLGIGVAAVLLLPTPLVEALIGPPVRWALKALLRW